MNETNAMDPGYFDIPREEHPYVKANVFSKLSFWYTRPLFIKGRNGDLSMSDVYRCLPDHRGVLQGDSLGAIWRREVDSKGTNKKPSLLRAIMKLHGFKYFIVNLMYSILDSSIRLSTPWCLEGLIKYFSVTNSGVDTYEAYLYAAGVVGFMLVAAGMNHSMILFAVDISTKVQIACCSLVYRKLLRLDVSAGGVACEGLAGHVVNLQTTDIQRFHLASIQAVDMIRAPLESIVTVYLMYRYIGVSTFIGVAFLMLFIPLQGYLGKLTSRLRRQIAARTDNRIRLMNEVIQSIETIKMYVWESAFAGIVGKARKKEMGFIKKMSWLRAVMISCVKLNTKVAIFLSIISYISFGNELTAAKVFVIFSYYDILKMSLVDSLPLGIASTMEALVGVKRVQEFLLLPEVDNQDGVDLLTIDPERESKRVFEKIGNGTQTYIQSEAVEHMETNVLVSFKQFTAHWRTADEKADKTVALSDVNLNILPGTLTVVIGAVGSGKTTLLHAILRELPLTAGYVDIACVTSYAAQDPWIFEGTVRQNILFGQELDLRRYKAVVKCCQLRSDLELLPHGDRTVVGERGASLSGGQRARLSLARCLYRAADLYLLDDPLAAVDAKVAQALYEECVRGFLRDRAVVLVTHHVHYARQADNICVMRNGRVAAQGTYQELKDSVPELHVESNAIAEVKEKVEYERHESMELTRRIHSQRSMSSVSQLSFSMDLEKTELKYEGETQTKGSVERDTYVQYIRSGGGACTVVILLALFVVAQLFYSASDVWLKDWVNLEESYSMKLANSSLQENNQTESVEYTDITANKFGLSRSACVYVYAALIGVCVFFTWNKLLVFYNTCIRASVALHDNMFRGVTNAPMWFFHHNPSGRILNRFSKDMGQVDSLLPIALVDCFGFFLEIIAILVVVCLVNWWLALPTAAVSVLLYLIRSYYIGTSRELKRMEAIAKSQVLNHANSTVSGLTTVRSCGSLQRTLCRELDKLQDLHSAAWFLYVSANRAFGFWMDMICCVYLAVVTFSFFLLVGEESLGGAVGLAITQAISLVNICRLGMRQTAEVENQMTSVERILEYANLPSEEPLEPDMKALKENHPNLNFETWPEKGEIVFEDVSLEYEKPPRKDASSEKGAGEEPAYAIRGVHFRVLAGEKVCVVGRTGAGKSSLIAALFVLARTHGGVAVDGVRARSAGLRAWRRRLCALPQRPALFAGTLRDNLDPMGARTDAELHAALREVGLGALAGAAEGLSWRVGDGGGNLSSGQRQLLCLARAVLARPRVLVLDEATANVDGETDKAIQASIRTKFAASTVLTIAHRLHTVMDYDRVIVMDKGRVAETGHPYELLTKTRSDCTPIKRSFKRQISQTIPEHFASSNDMEETCRLAEGAGIFKSLVEQAGPETAATLFEMAKESYRTMEAMKADQADKTKV
ncbi:probable multidrug resistance-associated protein lethal(2)03659 [Aricia agestis]|uniref:probable multidrug resistance-associated protein lethal(2)03659 n=1 Tax=Aricia agestis TaxID=91739 RepID=UPI001C20725B|nr:probable multidrug resistance-associated protein lethal(2)03659 [Aricia agestis]